MPCSKYKRILKNGTVIILEHLFNIHSTNNFSVNLQTNNNSDNYGDSFDLFINNSSNYTTANNNNAFRNTSGSSSSSSNSSSKEICLGNAPTLTNDTIIQIIVLLIMGIASLFGNIATIWNIKHDDASKRISRHGFNAINYLLYHLSIADLFVTAFCIFGDAGWKYSVGWLAGDIVCKLVKFTQMFGLYLSTYVSILIGLDRWIAVKYPMKKLSMTKRYHRLLAGTYILSLILSIPQCIVFKVVKGPFLQDFYQCGTFNTYSQPWHEQLYAIFTLLFNFLIPLILIIASYASTFTAIAGSEKAFAMNKQQEMNNRVQSNRQKIIHRAKMKSLRISIAIITAFLICWTPYYIMMLTFMFWNPNDSDSMSLQYYIFFFGMSNSVMNPIIYGAFQLMPKRKDSTVHNITRDGSIYHRTTKSSVISVSDTVITSNS